MNNTIEIVWLYANIALWGGGNCILLEKAEIFRS